MIEADVPIWLARRRVTAPDRIVGYMHRPKIAARCRPVDHALTIVHAPAGFGKTTLVAESCRAEAARGVAIAWLLLDERDDEARLDTYLAFAFRQAGLDVGELSPSAARVRESDRRISIILRAIAADTRPWILALDELERVGESGLPVLNELFRGEVPNLHIVAACRQLPRGLEIALPLDRANVIAAEDLRFSRMEMAQFFGGTLSQRELGRLATEASGWPIALHVEREKREKGHAGRAQVLAGVASRRLESRLWYDLADDDRELVLDAGVLEWMDADLVDEVLSGRDLLARLQSLPGIAGLLESAGGGSSRAWRLHTLVREFCASRRRREAPERYRSIHRRTARALAERGDTLEAVRHAAEAGDSRLAGEIVIRAGGLRLLFTQGSARLVAIDRLIDDETVALSPRLTAVRIVALAFRDQFEEARKLAAATRKYLGGDTVDIELQCDMRLAEAILASRDSPRVLWVTAGLGRLVERPDLEPMTRATLLFLQITSHLAKSEFDVVLEAETRIRQCLGGRMPDYLSMSLDSGLGQMEMLRGRVREARARYRRLLKKAKGLFSANMWQAKLGELLMQELELERNHVPAADSVTRIPSHEPSTDIAVDLGCEAQGVDYALRIVERVREGTQHSGAKLKRHLAGLRVGLLAGAGRADEAEEHWRQQGLPQSLGACVDLTRLSWREMEVLACARLRVCTAKRDFEGGRRLAADLLAVASEKGLRRIEMRALAQAMAHEHAAGEPGLAVEHLTEFLRLFAKTDYARPMVRERASAVPVLTRFIETKPGSRLEKLAAELLMAARTAGDGVAPKLTAREFEVLGRLEMQTDAQIAAELGLTASGVRYHVQRVFTKLGVHSRKIALERARSLGIV